MRAIDAEELKKGIERYFCNVCSEPEIGKCKACDIAEILSMIDDTPTAEVESTELAAQIMQRYGAEHQQLKLCEECGELIQAAIKAHEIGADITTDFVGELADVYILIKQFIATMPTVWRTEFDTMVSFKLQRQIERTENEV